MNRYKTLLKALIKLDKRGMNMGCKYRKKAVIARTITTFKWIAYFLPQAELSYLKYIIYVGFNQAVTAL